MSIGDDVDTTKLASLRVYSHILQKGFQAGSLIGLIGVVPVVAYNQHRKGVKLTFTNLAPPIASAVSVSAGAGVILTGCLGAARLASLDRDGIEDRAYRLYYNKDQTRTDIFANIGGFIGGGTAMYTLGATAVNAVGGASIGAALGVLLHVLTNSAEPNKPNVMLEEAKQMLEK